MNNTMIASLIATMTLLTRADFVDADYRQCRNGDDHHHCRHIDDRTGHLPGAVRSVVSERRTRIGAGYGDAEIVEEAHHIARPADGDGGGTERVFEEQIPADDPSDQLAHRGVGISVGAARDRYGRGHLGIAQAGAGADEAGEYER